MALETGGILEMPKVLLDARRPIVPSQESRYVFNESVSNSHGSCIVSVHIYFPAFPLGLKNLEKWEGIFQSGKNQGILNRLEKSGKITQNNGKLGEFQKKIYLLIFSDIQMNCVLLAKMDKIFS